MIQRQDSCSCKSTVTYKALPPSEDSEGQLSRFPGQAECCFALPHTPKLDLQDALCELEWMLEAV